MQETFNESVYLKDIREDLIRDTEKLLQITPNMRKVFKAVCNSLNILIWLKENLKGRKSCILWCYQILPFQYEFNKFWSPAKILGDGVWCFLILMLLNHSQIILKLQNINSTLSQQKLSEKMVYWEAFSFYHFI